MCLKPPAGKTNQVFKSALAKYSPKWVWKGLDKNSLLNSRAEKQQRVAIARALLNTPEIIIADEPTGNLDPQTNLEIMEVFQKLHQQGMSVLMATHDYNMIVKFPGKSCAVTKEPSMR